MKQSDFIKQNPLFFLMERSGHKPEELSPAFPGMSVEQITSMLMDNRFGLRRKVERFGYLGIRECDSRYFNVDKNGRRLNGVNSSADNDGVKIHCYGGSTTLGANVSDKQTISSYLESELRKKQNISVYNFGAGNHTSLHSSLRLLDNALSGNVPDLAIFLNGFNDCSYALGGADGVLPFLDSVLTHSQDLFGKESKLSDFIDLIPAGSSIGNNAKLGSDIKDEDLINVVKAHYAASVSIQKFVAKYFAVKILRFIEPTSFLKCRTEQFLLPRISSGNIRFGLVKRLYEIIDDHGCEKVFGNEEFISLVDIGQDLLPSPLYVDEAHFSPAFNEYIAKRIETNIRFSRLGSSTRQRKLPMREIKGTLDDVVDPFNYPLF